MIARYTRSEMKNLWSEENKFRTWLKVELAVLEVVAEKGLVPKDSFLKIQKKAAHPDIIDVKRILKIEETVKHDVIAFTTSIAEKVGGEDARFFHYGLTSSDVVDTALGLLLKDAVRLLEQELSSVIKVLEALALKYKKLPTIGRTHGIHGEPTSFGLKFLGFYSEFMRHKQNLSRVRESISHGKLSGAVGTYGALSPEVEKQALDRLGLKVEPVSTQVIPRDRHGDLLCVFAQIGASIERVAVEFRHLQRTEVNEIEEEFSAGQKGSSAMPHKKNPISSENLTGCARLLRGYALSTLENVALWHERDISHSSVERVVLPDSTTLLHYMLHRLKGVLSGLKVNTESVEKNLNQTLGIYFSGHILLALVQKGETRERAYAHVQKAAHRAFKEGKPFQGTLWKDSWIRGKFSKKEYETFFQVSRFLKNVNSIYDRVLGNNMGKINPSPPKNKVFQ